MARIDIRLQVWGWLTRRMVSIATMSDADVIALQAKQIPANPVTNWLFGTVPPGVGVTDRSVPGPAGDLKVRVYRPAATAGDAPLVLYFHGGGFSLGSLDLGNWICGTVAAKVEAVVVSVDYRLAPSRVFPAAVEDCYAALAWAAASAAELGATGRIGVLGESAGGNLAAVSCLIARERGGPAISHQALIYPATDMTKEAPATADPSAPFLSAAEISTYKRLYLGPEGDPANPWASPLLADHAGLPPALIQVGEHDPIRDDGVRYAAALRAAGVPVRFTEYVGMPHGFVNFPGLSRQAHQALAEVCAEQSAALVPSRASAALPSQRPELSAKILLCRQLPSGRAASVQDIEELRQMWNLKNAARELAPVARAFPSHPVRVVKSLPDEWRQRMGRTSTTEADFDDDWNEHLHGLLGAPWPCPEVQQSHDLLAEVAKLLTEKGFGTGLHTYGWYSDADMDMCTAIWCAIRHRRPEVVMETGVAHGVSSRVVLEALNQNDRGHLWSIDIPNPLNRRVHGQEGAAVTEACRPRWTYVEGESSLRMPPLVKEVGKVELFIHDSLHTFKNTLFEMEQAASVMPAGGVMLIDDIRSHDGFLTFAKRHPEFKTILVSTLDGIGAIGIAVST